MKCTYNYKGQELDRKTLLEQVKKDAVPNQNTVFTISGSKSDLQFQQMQMQEQAKALYGTDEFLGFELQDGVLTININGEAIEQLTDSKQLLYNKTTGKTETADVEKLIARERAGRSIPNYSSWLATKVGYFADKAVKSIENFKSPEKDYTKDLKQRLIGFANELGVEVQTMEDYLANRQLREETEDYNIEGLADMLNKVIAVTNDNNMEVLTEEVGHFAVEYADADTLEQLINAADQTNEYQQNYEQYRQIYSKTLSGEALERKIRKEALGKELSNRIRDNFQREDGLTGLLRNLWNKIKQIFTQNQKALNNLNTVLDEIAYDVLEGNADKFLATDSKEVYYNLQGDNKKLEDSIQKSLKILRDGYKREVKSGKEVIDVKRRQKINQIEEDISYEDFKSAINHSISLIDLDLKKAIETINQAKRKEGGLSENIGEVDLANLITFHYNFEPFMSAMQDEIRTLKNKEKFLTADEKKNLSSTAATKLNNSRARTLSDYAKRVKQKEASISNDVRDIIDDKSVEAIERVFRSPEVNATEDVIEEILSNVGQYRDISLFTKYLGSIRKIANPIVSAIYALTAKAEGLVETEMYPLLNKLENIAGKTDINESELQDEGFIVNAFHQYKLEKAYQEKVDAIKEEYAKQIKENPSDRTNLEDIRDIKLEELSLEWKDRRFAKETYKDLLKIENGKAVYSKDTRAFINQKRVDKYNILSPAIDENGNLDFRNVSPRMIDKLDALEREYKQEASLYTSDGSMKTGRELQRARQLRKYAKSFSSDSSNPNQQEYIDKFEKERKEVLSKYGEKSQEYISWLRANGVFNYSDADWKTIDSGGTVLDVENTEAAIVASGYSVYDLMDGVEDGENLIGDYNAMYEALLDKRRQLIAPYRSKNNPSEIDGEMLEDLEPELLDTLDALQSKIDVFKRVKNPEIEGITIRGNQAYYRKLNSLQGRAKEEFKRRVGAGDDNVPTVYHYRTFNIDVSTPIEKKWLPNFKYMSESSFKRQENPNYEIELAGRAEQWNRNHPEVKKFINNDFHDYFGIDKEQDFWGLRGATKNKDAYEYRKVLIEAKAEDDSSMKVYGNNGYYLLPQIAADPRESLGRKSLKDIISGFSQSEFEVIGDEEIIGDKDRIHVPKRYVRRLPDPNTISGDLGLIYAKYKASALNYKHKNKVLPEILLLRDKLSRSTIEGADNAQTSNMFRMLDNFLSQHMYGNMVNEIGTLQFGKRTFSGAKLSRSLYNTITKINLGGNLVTPIVGATSSVLFNTLEGLSGGQINTDSLKTGTVETAKLIGDLSNPYAIDSVKIKSQNKLRQLFKFSGVNVRYNESFDGLNRGIGYRESRNVLFKPYEMASVVSGGVAMISIFDGYRLVDGKFVNHEQYQGDNWKEQTNTYYSYLEQADGEIRINEAKLRADGFEGDIGDLKAIMSQRAQAYHQKTEGQATKLDRPYLYANPYMQFLGMHFQWFFNAAQNRFQKKEFDVLESRMVEGNYRTAWRLFLDGLTDPNTPVKDKVTNFLDVFAGAATLGWYSKAMDKLEGFEQSNLKRIALDFYAYGTLFALFVIANRSADEDEDDWMKQYMAYVSSRVLGEQGSIMIPFGVPEFWGRVQEPVAGTRNIEAMLDLMYLASPTQWDEWDAKVKRGKYKGMEEWQKRLLSATFIKNIYLPYRKLDSGKRAGYRQTNLYFRHNMDFLGIHSRALGENE